MPSPKTIVDVSVLRRRLSPPPGQVTMPPFAASVYAAMFRLRFSPLIAATPSIRRSRSAATPHAVADTHRDAAVPAQLSASAERRRAAIFDAAPRRCAVIRCRARQRVLPLLKLATLCSRRRARDILLRRCMPRLYDDAACFERGLRRLALRVLALPRCHAARVDVCRQLVSPLFSRRVVAIATAALMPRLRWRRRH